MSLTEHELDRLADYTVDVLEPDDAAAVSHLIETDPRWAAAYRSLLAADATIRADLGTLGAAPEPMPADVAARIDRALTDFAPRSKDLASRTNVIPIDQARGQERGRAGRRTKALGWLAGAAAAAAAVVGGVAALTQGATQFATTTSGAPAAERGSAADAAQPQAAPPAQPLPTVSGSRVVATNTDYQPDTLGSLASTVFSAAGAAPEAGAVSGDSTSKNNPQMADQAVAPLAALTAPTTLDSCLKAVLASHPGTVTALDYARYLGRPALVIVVRQVAGTVVVAVGEKCGIAGTDEKAAVPGK